jgi:uncharacterized protein (UPF0332 family)
MSTTVSEIIGLASSLVECDTDKTVNEAMLRCAASRAYYAALHAAGQSLPPDLMVSTEAKKGRSSHQAVIDAVVFWAKSVRPGRMEAGKVARNLPRLRDTRKKADYELGQEFSVAEAMTSLKIATATIESANRASERAETLQA